MFYHYLFFGDLGSSFRSNYARLHFRQLKRKRRTRFISTVGHEDATRTSTITITTIIFCTQDAVTPDAKLVTVQIQKKLSFILIRKLGLSPRFGATR